VALVTSMTNLSVNRPHLSLLFLAAFCTLGTLRAQDPSAGTTDHPLVLSHKEEARLALVRSIPDYPAVARVNYLEGPVLLTLTVNARGLVTNVHVLKGDAILAAAALKAASRWIYSPLAAPAGRSGFITTVKLRFTLRGMGAGHLPPDAERDFLRQIKPAQIVRPPEDERPEVTIHMRLLVNDDGEVVDRQTFDTENPRFKAACETLRSWKFSAARWGTLPIASYLDVNVPVHSSPVMRTAAITERH
jgi:TonB family protein